MPTSYLICTLPIYFFSLIIDCTTQLATTDVALHVAEFFLHELVTLFLWLAFEDF